MAKIYVVKQAYEADVVAAKVADPGEADILVFLEPGGAGALGDTLWFHAGKFGATCKLFWTGRDDPKALKVFFVKERSEARWVRDHPLRGQL
jgi:hypothetical protein